MGVDCCDSLIRVHGLKLRRQAAGFERIVTCECVGEMAEEKVEVWIEYIKTNLLTEPPKEKESRCL